MSPWVLSCWGTEGYLSSSPSYRQCTHTGGLDTRRPTGCGKRMLEILVTFIFQWRAWKFFIFAYIFCNVCVLPVALVQRLSTGDAFAPRRYWAVSGDIFEAHHRSGRGGCSRVLAGGGQGGCETGHHAGRPQNRAGPSPNVSSADPETLAQPAPPNLSLHVPI